MVFDPIKFTKGLVRRNVKKTKLFAELRDRETKIVFQTKKDGTPSKKYNRLFRCAGCNEWFKDKEVELDHIWPVARHHTLEEFVKLTLCDSHGMQFLCKPCHKIKTKIDNLGTKEWKEQNVARRVGRVVHAGFVDGVWYLLFRNKDEAEQYCEDNNLDYEDLDKLDNGLWRLETDLRVRTGEDEL